MSASRNRKSLPFALSNHSAVDRSQNYGSSKDIYGSMPDINQASTGTNSMQRLISSGARPITAQSRNKLGQFSKINRSAYLRQQDSRVVLSSAQTSANNRLIMTPSLMSNSYVQDPPQPMSKAAQQNERAQTSYESIGKLPTVIRPFPSSNPSANYDSLLRSTGQVVSRNIHIFSRHKQGKQTIASIASSGTSKAMMSQQSQTYPSIP